MADTKPQSGKERRMVLRLLEFWREAKGDAAFPTPAQFNDSTMPELFPYCIVLDVTKQPTDPVAVAIGRSMSSFTDTDIKGLAVSQFAPNTLPAHAAAYVVEVLRKQVPISRGGSFVDGRGMTILYRSIVLPLAHDGTAVTTLIAAANCREVAGA